MESLLQYSIEEITDLLKVSGQPAYRAKQLYKWLNCGVDFDSMSDIPKNVRQDLSEKYLAQPLTILEQYISSDKSIKLLYKLSDGNIIEGVFMPHNYGDTLCVSTQVGCRMNCGFCASGLGGLVRNLTAAEILGQVTAVNKLQGGDVKNRKITNVVLMGSGEPLDNYDNVVKFFKLITCGDGLNISQRNISLSTCGLPDQIKRLADEGYGVTLSLSLHATTDEARSKIMPIAKKHKLDEVIKAVRHYFEVSGRRVIFEYAMIKGVNMDFFDCKRLEELSRGMACHINLIKLNYVKERNMSGCTDAEAERFKKRLEEMGLSATIRRSFGSDVGGACGQLRRGYLEKN